MICIVLAMLAGEAGAQQSPELPAAGPDPDTLSIDEGLDLILSYELTTRVAETIARRAGESGNATYIPTLKQIAEAYSVLSESVSFNALHGLWLLGEPQDYFLQNAQQYNSNRNLAYYSIWVMARAPDSTTLTLLEELGQAPTDGLIQSAVITYKGVLELIAEYEALGSVEEKLDALAGQLTRGYDFALIAELWEVPDLEDVIDKGDYLGYLDPEVVWARNKLAEVGTQYPSETQQYIAIIPNSSFFEQELEGFSTQQVARAAQEFQAYVERSAFPDGVPPPGPAFPDLPGAITLASDDAAASFSGGTFTISGFDHALDGTPDPTGQDAHGLFTTSTEAQQNLLSALAPNQQESVVGLNAPPDIAQGSLDFDPAALLNDLLDRVTDTLSVAHTGTIGSLESPVVAYAPDGLTLAGSLSGTGVLIVDGALVEQGGVTWTGLVIVRADGAAPPAFEMHGNVSVTGGVLLYNETSQAASLVITGNAEVRYSRAAFEMLRTALFSIP